MSCPKKTFSCPECKGRATRKGIRRGKLKLLCKTCHKWFQVNRRVRENTKACLLAHLCGESFRTISGVRSISPATAFRRYKDALDKLPHCADITRKYCNKFCGILSVDGKYIKIKGYERKIPVIYGIDYLTRDIPNYILSPSENYPALKSFFASLRLLKYPLQALVSDDNYNIPEACKSIYPGVVTQLCQIHFKENIKVELNLKNEDTYKSFMYEINKLFAKRRSLVEFDGVAGKIYWKYRDNPKCKSVLLDIQRRKMELLAYTDIPRVPRTSNLIESYNSHLQGRLKTIKGFESFNRADSWLNACFVRRRLKTFTSCDTPFRYLNGHSSIQMALNDNYKTGDVLKLIR